MTVIADEGLEELQALCPSAEYVNDGSQNYIHIPRLPLPDGRVVEALLSHTGRDGYVTRLFLSESVVGKGSNWSTHRILDKTWHTWSWKDVSADQRPIEILADHLRALR